MKDPREKILDAFLDEVLNDSRPRRSSGEILQHVRDNLGELKTTGTISDPDAVESPLSATLTNESGRLSPSNPAAAAVARQSVDSRNWLGWLSLAAALVAAVSIGIVLLNRTPDRDEQLVDDNVINTTKRPTPDTQSPLPANNPGLTRNEPPHLPTRDPDRPRPADQPLLDQTPRVAVREDIPKDPNAVVLPDEFVRVTNLDVTPQSAYEMAQNINGLLYQAWDVSGLQPARALDSRNWVNRLTTRVLGRPLSAEELVEIEPLLAQGKEPDQVRADLVNHFLDSPRYQSEFGQHWGQVLAWKILGISPSMSAVDRDMLQTRDLLVQQITKAASLDQVAYQLISAVGSTSADQPDFNPAASYMVGLRKRFGSAELASAHVADAFLGLDAQCAQCHDSFGDSSLAGFSQRDFFQFHSFFAQLSIRPIHADDPTTFTVANQNYLPLGQQGLVAAAIKYQDPRGMEYEAFPKLADFELDTNGFVAKVDRRTALARQIAAAPEFRETMVDHVWSSMLNLPLSGVDGSISPQMAELRSKLADQLAANGFDLQWLVKSIAASNAFAVGVANETQLAANNPFLGQPPLFHVFYSRLENRRSALQSLGIVANAYTSGDVNEALTAGLLARVDNAMTAAPNFIHPFVPSKDSEWATSPRITQHLEKIVASTTLTPEQKVRHLIQAALGRPAYDEELRQALVIVGKSRDQRTAMQDVWWSLLNSVDYKIPLDVR